MSRAAAESAPTVAAKLTPPSAEQAVPRTRLFQRLDQASRCRVVCVTGPPGSGKTTLVASWLADRGRPVIWYQLDPSDEDLGAFFYHLGQGAAALGRGSRGPLPELGAEHAGGVAAFSTTFFRELASGLAAGTVLAFDDYQEIGAATPFHDLLAAGVEDLPPGVTVLLVGRDGDPPAFARFRLRRELEIVDWTDLRLDPDEAHALVAADPSPRVRDLSPDAVERSLADSGGWVSGFRMLLAYADVDLAGARRSAAYDHLGTRLLEKLEPPTRNVLLATSVVRRFTAPIAARLTGEPDVATILADLRDRQFFLDVRGGEEPVYEFHSLFRRLLLSRLARTMRPADVRRLRRLAAAELRAAGFTQEAVEVHEAAADWAGLRELIVASAPELVAHGRLGTLEDWIQRLPPGEVDRDPWVLAWEAMCRLPSSPVESRERFERAYARFRERGDRDGAFFAWCGVVETILHDWSDLRLLDVWIRRADELLREGKAPDDPVLGARFATGVFAALFFRRPERSDVRTWMDRAVAICRTGAPESQRILTSVFVSLYLFWVGEPGEAEVHLDGLRAAARSPSASPLARLAGCYIEAIAHWYQGRPEAAIRTVDEGSALADGCGIHMWDNQIIGEAIEAALLLDDPQRGEPYLARMGAALDEGRRLDASYYHFQRAAMAYHRGDLPGSIHQNRDALELAEQAGAVFPAALNHATLAQALWEAGQRRAAASHLRKAERIGRAMKSHLLVYSAGIVAARFARERGKEVAARAALEKALATAREHHLLAFAWLRRPTLVPLLEWAIEIGVEATHARRILDGLGTAAPVRVAGPEAASLVREGDFWTVSVGTKAVRLRNAKGLEYLCVLLSHPGRELHALQLLAGAEHGDPGAPIERAERPLAPDGGQVDEVFDRQAQRDYELRIRAVQGELDEAEANGDLGRAPALRAELEALTEEVARGLGLGGRRRPVGSAAERARLSVTKAIRKIIRRLEKEEPTIGRLLASTIRTGTFLRYDPDPTWPVEWTLESDRAAR